MGLFNKLFKGDDKNRVDYYREGTDLLGVGKYHEALTSFRLALRETPRDSAVLQQMAIAYTRIGMTDEAIKTYRTLLEREPQLAGAHYGLAFLMLHTGARDDGARHLREFLAHPPDGAEAKRHIDHARQTLAELNADPSGQAAEPSEGA